MIYLVFTTVAKRNEAVQMAEKILHQRLAACVHIAPMGESHYWWKGQLERTREISLTFKTTKKALSRLLKTIKTIHSYETPEILAVRVEKSHPLYEAWVAEETRRKLP